ncbi:MAG: nucleotidyltransferase domain-containing protein [Turicibacter sp.]|nr:nucleotidyltransferase domain-containing protein [Turicibacter sp.]
MYKHHKESIEKMIEHYQENQEIQALFLVGSVATGTERPDSDLDGVAIVSPEYFEYRQHNGGLEEVVRGKCTYEAGYFNIHYMTKEHMTELIEKGSEPMRNLFCDAVPLYCYDEELASLASSIPIYPTEEAKTKQFKFYCTFKMYHTYYWKNCKPEGFARYQVAVGMIYNLYRLLLIENEILFPSMRKLEAYVLTAPNLPDGIVAQCRAFLQSLTDEDAENLVLAYENWTSYDLPKDHNTVMNNFQEPLEWV